MEDPTFVSADDAGPIEDPPVIEEAEAILPVVKATTPPNPFGPDVEPVEAYIAEDRMQAHFVAEELTSQGIPAVADSHEPNETLGGLLELPRVWVRRGPRQGQEWLAGFEATLREEHPR